MAVLDLTEHLPQQVDAIRQQPVPMALARFTVKNQLARGYWPFGSRSRHGKPDERRWDLDLMRFVPHRILHREAVAIP